MTILSFILDNWAQISGLLLAGFTIWKYFDARSRDLAKYLDARERALAWRHTEFIIEQMKAMRSDSDMVEVMAILDERHSLSVESVFGSKTSMDQSDRFKMLEKFEKYLDFIHNLAYAHFFADTISLKEVDCIAGWYIQRIGQSKSLVRWCNENGFDLLWDLYVKQDEQVRAGQEATRSDSKA